MQIVDGKRVRGGVGEAARHVVAVIPARYSSKRFPGKALAQVGGRPMVVAVWERVREARGIDRVIVATDDDRIRVAVESAGGLQPTLENADMAPLVALFEADIKNYDFWKLHGEKFCNI